METRMTKEDVKNEIMICRGRSGYMSCSGCGSYKLDKCNWHNMLNELEDDNDR